MSTELTKIPGSGCWALCGLYGLYTDGRHLLQIRSLLFQTYTRIYFEDVQAVVVQNSSERTIKTVLWVIPSLLFILPAILLQTIWVALPGIFFAILVLLNLLRGPTCSFYVMTRTGKRQLRTLRRKKRVEQVWDKHIQPMITELQGEGPTEDPATTTVNTEA